MFDIAQCDDCDGACEICTRCNAIPDNCNCDGETFEECEPCGGTGAVEVDADECRGQGVGCACGYCESFEG